MFQELLKAVELEPNKETYSLIIKAYRSHDMNLEADQYQAKLDRLKKLSTKPKRLLRPSRRVII
jgi:hypothetical protein